MVKCYQCGLTFEPDAAQVQAWAENGKRFDPTDWECEDCRRTNDPAFNEDAYPSAEYWE